MPQNPNEQNNYFICVFLFFFALTLLCLISLAFVFLALFLHTEGNFTLFEFTFLRLSHSVCYYYLGDSGSKQSLISLRHSAFRSVEPSSKLANTMILHAQFGQRHTWISIFLRAGLLLCIYVLVQLNFHAFLVVFSVTLTHTHKHGYHWKLALQQLLLIFASIRLCVDRLWNTTSTVSSKAKATIQF